MTDQQSSTPSDPAALPLTGVRILDLSRVLAGPYCTATLADVGAEVIKIEVPGHGDDARSIGPFRGDESLYFAQLNRNKRSLSLNLRDPAGVAILCELAAGADVLVENYRPGVTRRLGIDYDTLHAINPRLVYTSVSGYGQDGPLATLPAYDLVIQAASGLMSITGAADGPPTRVGESLADLWAGLYAAWATMTALYERDRTGIGRQVDVAMFDTMIALQVTAFSQLQATGMAPGRVGNRHPVSTPFDSFAARDGMIVIAVASDALFDRLATMIGRSGLAADPRFASDEARTRNERDLHEIIEGWSRVRSTTVILEEAARAGVPAGPVNDLREAVESEQSRARRLVRSFQLEDPAHSVEVVLQPVRFSGVPAPEPSRRPALGEHSAEILSEILGYPAERVRELRERKVI